MGEEDLRTDVNDAVANGTELPEAVGSHMVDDKEEQNTVKEMEEDSKNEEKVEAKVEEDAVKKDEVKEEAKMELDKEEKHEEKNETMEKRVLGEGEQEEDMKDEKVDVSEEKTNNVEESKEKVEGPKNRQEEKSSKKRRREKSTENLADESKKAEVKEQDEKTPTALGRPVRERKSVERLVAVIERDMYKDFLIEKGRGTPLKDIPNGCLYKVPEEAFRTGSWEIEVTHAGQIIGLINIKVRWNVAYKLSRKKGEDTLKLLHTILFGRRGKAGQIKSNISRFSGFVWRDNEEKQQMKVKEKLDKCVKEKLSDFCDVLDIPIAKTTTKKDDLVAKLLDFLVAPHATTTELLSEKEQSSRGKKRVREVSASRSWSTSSKRSVKSRKKSDDSSKREVKKSASVVEDDSEEEEEKQGDEAENGLQERSDDENAGNKERNDATKEQSKEDAKKARPSAKKKPSTKGSAGKEKTKEITSPKKSTSQEKGTSKRSSSKLPKVNDDADTSPKVFSRKNKVEKVSGKVSVSKRSASEDKSDKKAAKGKKPKDGKAKPTDDELKNAVCEILKEVDFNTATLTDIMKQLAKRFNTDMTPRKAAVKVMVQDELTKLADEADDDEDDEDSPPKEYAKRGKRGVKA